MSDSVPERLSSIETTLKGQDGTLSEIKGYLQRSAQERTSQHTETVTRLAVLESSVNNYQKNCDDDRKDINKKVYALEKKQSFNSGKNTMLAAGISFIVTGVGLTIEYFKR